MGVDQYLPDRGAGIRVGVADTGVGPHPNLNHVTNVGAFIGGLHDPAPAAGADVDLHGSHVCGTIGAQPQQPGDFAGIAPGVELFSARVFPRNGGANQGDIASAIDYLSSQRRVDLINLSLGSAEGSQIERDAIIDALERGTLCICAAANDGREPVDFPARFPETIAVSAVGLEGWGPSGSLASMNYPVDPDKYGMDNLYLANFSNFGAKVACCAPGVGIISTVPARPVLQAPYAAMDGTSMASPAACGILAALLSSSPDYLGLPRDITRSEAARALLRASCRDIGIDDKYQGRGLIRIRA
jgi:subtilisin